MSNNGMILNLTELSDEPLQGQIARQLRALILAGDMEAEASLPSIRSLARQQRVSVITVQRAYEALMREGLIHSRRGKGFFVSAIEQEQKETMARERLAENITPALKAALAEGLDFEDVLNVIQNIIEKERTND
jgi:GntR family transcriptional regulator